MFWALFFNFSRSAVIFFAHTQKYCECFVCKQKKLQLNDWSVKNTQCLFYYSKIIQKFQILKKNTWTSKNLKKQTAKNPTFLFLVLMGQGGGTFHLHFWNPHKIWIKEFIDLNSIRFGRYCNIGWVTSAILTDFINFLERNSTTSVAQILTLLPLPASLARWAKVSLDLEFEKALVLLPQKTSAVH